MFTHLKIHAQSFARDFFVSTEFLNKQNICLFYTEDILSNILSSKSIFYFYDF